MSPKTSFAPQLASELFPLVTMRECAAGTVVRLEQCGGSGYGNPLERPAEAVMTDVRNGYVSAGAAARE